MERALQKLAKQLNQYDSASLTALWDRYAQQVARFEPTQRWEEAALVFCMLQSVHWKNQLFNAEMLKSQARPGQSEEDKQLKERLKSYAGGRQNQTSGVKDDSRENSGASGSGGKQKQRRKVLLFPAGDTRKP